MEYYFAYDIHREQVSRFVILFVHSDLTLLLFSEILFVFDALIRDMECVSSFTAGTT